MKGSFDVRVSRRRSISFEFQVRRNITVVRGDSGTGKTTLYDMVADRMRLGDASGVSLRCERPCVALTDMNWEYQLRGFEDSIVFVDEGFPEVATDVFARALRDSGNYCVIFCREELRNLPYSVDEVYEISSSGKFHRFRPLYRKGEGFRYDFTRSGAGNKETAGADGGMRADFSVLLTEDARSSWQFFESRLGQRGISCETSAGNAGIVEWLLAHEDENIFVFADGAAFGPYADRVLKMQRERPGSITVCLPESFEWLLLRSGIVRGADVERVLANPGEFIDCRDCFSWEQFFSRYLQDATAQTPLAYSKGRLREPYKEEANASKVMALIAFRNIG